MRVAATPARLRLRLAFGDAFRESASVSESQMDTGGTGSLATACANSPPPVAPTFATRANGKMNAVPRARCRKSRGDYFQLFVYYLTLLFFQRSFGLFLDHWSKNVSYFRQDYLRLFEIVDYLNYLQLF